MSRLHWSLAVLTGGLLLSIVTHDALGEGEVPDSTDSGSEPVTATEPDGEAEPALDAHHEPGKASHEPERIVITATPIEHDKDELAVPVNRLDRTEVLDRAQATIGETLATLPGIATSGFTAGASRPVIRGQDAFRTGMVEDGLPTQDVSRESPDHAVPVNPIALERLEVVRGPATLRYGGGASAGVVNAITNRVPDALPEEPVTGSVFGALDAVADRRDLNLNLDGGVGPVAWHLDGLLRRTRNYEIPPGGRQKGTFADAFSGSGGAAYIFEDGSRFGASFTRFESEYGIPEEDEKAEIDMHSNRVRFEGDWNSPVPGIAQVRLRGLWSDYEHEEKVDGVVGQTFDNDQFDGRLEWVHGDVLGFVGAAGFTGSTRDLKAGGEAAEFLAPTDTNSGAFYVFEERELLDSLVTELGFRVEGSVVEGTPFGDTQRVDKSFTPVSGSAGLVYSPNEQWSVGLIGAASQRAPAESELFARGPHESTETFEIGSPGLDEETSYTAEMRVTFRNECARVEVAGFVTRYDDYIFAQLTGVTVNEDGDVVPPTDPDALDQLFYRDRDALFAGFEVSSEVDLFEALWGTWGIEGQFDYVRARFTSGSDRNLPRITPIRWGSHLTYRGDLVRARFGFLRTEKQGDSSNFDSSTGSFTFLDAALFVRVTPLGERVPVEIGIQGTNLTDEKGRNHVSFQADEVLLPGRNIRGTVRVDF